MSELGPWSKMPDRITAPLLGTCVGSHMTPNLAKPVFSPVKCAPYFNYFYLFNRKLCVILPVCQEVPKCLTNTAKFNLPNKPLDKYYYYPYL